MDIAIVRKAFEVRLNPFHWDTLERQGAAVRSRVITEASELSGLYHPWYRLLGPPERIDAGWDWMGASPLRVLEVAGNPDLVTPHRAASIETTMESLRIHREYGVHACVPVQITILTYSLASLGELVVDGSHRIGAAARLALVGWPLQILVHTIVGSISGEICVDLNHYQPEGFPAELLKEPPAAVVTG